MRDYFISGQSLKHDLPASVVVFLVALPLCLGIALGSEAPLLSGLVAGIVGGVVVGLVSGSQISVSGPAAGLTAIVVAALSDINSFEGFLVAVILAGVAQIVLGFLKAGSIGHFFPVAVIKGMLAAIGLILIFKQIPHALGYDQDFEGDESFTQEDGQNTFTEIIRALQDPNWGAVIIAVVAILLMLLWEQPRLKRLAILQFIPGALVAVLVGVGLTYLYKAFFPSLQIAPEHFVVLPKVQSVGSFVADLPSPDFSWLMHTQIYTTAVTIALVASLESLLSIEAADKLDPLKRITPLNRELKAQGVGNIISGLLGGLPITAVIVRTSANVHAGARTRWSAVIHGVLLFVAIIVFPGVLNEIPFAALAGILIITGYKLTKPSLFQSTYQRGFAQFVPFVVTIVAILFTNLLIGIFIGIATGLLFVLKTNFHQAIAIVRDDKYILIKLNKDVSFLNKSVLRKTFESIPDGSQVIIDGGTTQFIDRDIEETIEDFIQNAPARNIQVELKKSYSSTSSFFKKD